ncbi:MAG: hypothetical protein Q9198_010203 [Flavoplaca austrocitrina]
MADAFDTSIDTSRRIYADSSSSEEERLSRPKTDLIHHTRSYSPTIAGSKPTVYKDTVEHSRNTSDRENQMTDTDLADFDDAKSGMPKKGVKDTRTDVQSTHVNDFHHFYWLAAAPTVPTSQDRSPIASREEGEQNESIYFKLNQQYLEQYIAQMQTYLQKRKKTSWQAYSRCPSHSLDEVDRWAAEIDRVKNEDDVMKKREKDHWLRKQAQADKDQVVEQKVEELKVIEAERRLAKQREKN